MSRRVLVLALDGATFDLIGPWLDDGSMPNLARLRAEGACGKLRSIVPPVTAPAWCSFMTGKNPGKHGVFEFFLREPGRFEEIPVSSRVRAGRTLWEILGDAGREVLVVNVPVTYPPSPVNGSLVGDFLTPIGARDFTWPPGLLDEIEAATGPFQLYHVEVYRKGRAGVVLDELDRVLEANRRATSCGTCWTPRIRTTTRRRRRSSGIAASPTGVASMRWWGSGSPPRRTRRASCSPTTASARSTNSSCSTRGSCARGGSG
jgi:predicted AlkP superfamily phosphohydrolase/phosphomutase